MDAPPRTSMRRFPGPPITIVVVLALAGLVLAALPTVHPEESAPQHSPRVPDTPSAAEDQHQASCPTPNPALFFEAETPHPPIRIDGNDPTQGLTVTAAAGPGSASAYRPGSGVVAGTGTPDDPYVIAGWTTPRIVLENTSAHVRVQQNNIRLQGPQGPDPGVPGPASVDDALLLVRNATNVTLAHNLVDRRYQDPQLGTLALTRPTIHIDASAHVRVVDNHVRRADKPLVGFGSEPSALRITESQRICLQSNIVEVVPETFGGILVVEESRDVLVRGHDLAPLETRVVDSPRVAFVDNVLGETSLRRSSHATLAANTFPSDVDMPPLENHTTSEEEAREFRKLDSSLLVVGSEPRHWDHTIPPTNIVHGKPLHYLSGGANEIIQGPAGQVVLHNTTNTTVRDIELASPLFVGFSRNTTVENATIKDVEASPTVEAKSMWVQGVKGFTVTGSHVDDAPIRVHSSRDLRIEHTRITGLRGEVVVWYSNGTSLHNLTYPDRTDTCSTFVASNDVRITGSRCLEVLSVGTRVASGTSDLPIPRNYTLRNNTYTYDGWLSGWAFLASTGEAAGVTAVDNNVTGFPHGFEVDYPAEIRGNNFRNVGAGVSDDHYIGEPTDARDNWWGCPAGPRGEDDSCAGIDGMVEYDPWLETPNPEAGAD